MKRYNRNGQLEAVLCNCCGKKLVVEHGIIREGSIGIDHAWDYFSEKTDRSIILTYVKTVMMNGFPASGCRWKPRNRLNYYRHFKDY